MVAILSAGVAIFAFRFRSRAALELKLIALQHQLAVLRRQRPSRPQLSSLDRLLWVLLYRIWPQVIDAMVMVRDGPADAGGAGGADQGIAARGAPDAGACVPTPFKTAADSTGLDGRRKSEGAADADFDDDDMENSLLLAAIVAELKPKVVDTVSPTPTSGCAEEQDIFLAIEITRRGFTQTADFLYLLGVRSGVQTR